MTTLRAALREIAQTRAHVASVVTIDRRERISQNFVRVWVSGEGLAAYTSPFPGDAFKLILAADGLGLPETVINEAGQPGPADESATVARALTVRSFDAGTRQLAFDVVVHPGVLADWLDVVAVGDETLIHGMRPEYPTIGDVDHRIVVADPTAVPAAAAIAEALPPGAPATFVLAVDDDSDRATFPTRDGARIVWAAEGFRPGEDHPLVEALAGVRRPQGRVHAWARAEASVMRCLRPRLLGDLVVDRDEVSLSAYWKAGLDQTEGGNLVRERMMALAAQGADLTSYDTLERAELDVDPVATSAGEQ